MIRQYASFESDFFIYTEEVASMQVTLHSETIAHKILFLNRVMQRARADTKPFAWRKR